MDRLTGDGADISACGYYRYRLWRSVLTSPTSTCLFDTCLFIMLNPSTADATMDDPTIRKCRGFCQRWGFGSFVVCNLFGLRSTSPRGLLLAQDPVGPGNDAFIVGEAAGARRIVLAWGSHHPVRKLVAARQGTLRSMLTLHATKTVVLGRAKDGNPRHPLMLSYSTRPEAWS